jgi:hypothetical protein
MYGSPKIFRQVTGRLPLCLFASATISFDSSTMSNRSLSYVRLTRLESEGKGLGTALLCSPRKIQT